MSKPLPSRFDSTNYSSEECQDVTHKWKAALLTIDPDDPKEVFEALLFFFSYISKKIEVSNKKRMF